MSPLFHCALNGLFRTYWDCLHRIAIYKGLWHWAEAKSDFLCRNFGIPTDKWLLKLNWAEYKRTYQDFSWGYSTHFYSKKVKILTTPKIFDLYLYKSFTLFYSPLEKTGTRKKDCVCPNLHILKIGKECSQIGKWRGKQPHIR